MNDGHAYTAILTDAVPISKSGQIQQIFEVVDVLHQRDATEHIFTYQS